MDGTITARYSATCLFFEPYGWSELRFTGDDSTEILYELWDVITRVGTEKRSVFVDGKTFKNRRDAIQWGEDYKRRKYAG